jgi:hypothetical protein
MRQGALAGASLASLAIRHGHEDILHLLMRGGNVLPSDTISRYEGPRKYPVNILKSLDNVAAEYAVLSGNTAMVKAVLDLGWAKTEWRDFAAFRAAAAMGNGEAQALLEPAFERASVQDKERVLAAAIKERQVNTVKYLTTKQDIAFVFPHLTDITDIFNVANLEMVRYFAGHMGFLNFMDQQHTAIRDYFAAFCLQNGIEIL